jgi:hypothetical protein
MAVRELHLDRDGFKRDVGAGVTFTINDADMAPSTAETTATGTTLAFAPTSTVSTGVLAIVLANWDNVSTTNADDTTLMGVTDTKGNTWIRAAEAQYSLSAIRDGVLNGVFYSVITTDILTSDTVTVTVASSTGTCSRAATLCAFNRDAAKTIGVAGKAYERVAAATTYSVTLGSLANEEHLWIGHNAMEDSAGSTNNADFTGFGGPLGNITQGGGVQGWGTISGGDENTASRGGYVISTGTTETYNTTGLTSADRVIVLVAFNEVAGAGGTALDPMGMSGFFGA